MNGFSLWVGFGSALGLWRLLRSAPQRQAGMWVNIGLAILLASLVGARLFYALINQGYFANHLIEIPQIWLGGLAWPGAVGAAWILLLYFAFSIRSARTGRGAGPGSNPLGWVSDRLYPLLPPVTIAAWLGCWMSGVAYGQKLPPGTWWGVPSLDESGAYSLRFPLQPLSALGLIIFFYLIETRGKAHQPAGRLSLLAVLGLLADLLLASFLRADPTPRWNGLRADTWMAILYFALLALTVLLAALSERFRNRPPVAGRAGT